MNNQKDDYQALKIVGMHVGPCSVSLYKKDEQIGKAEFQDILKVGVVKTNSTDTSGYFSFFMNLLINRSYGMESSGSASPIYALYIAKHDEDIISVNIQNFNLIGVSNEIKRLNKEIQSFNQSS